jgi:predicted small secreted protein
MIYRLLTALALLGLLTSCNTISGIGKDVGAAGETISDTADETKEEIAN